MECKFEWNKGIFIFNVFIFCFFVYNILFISFLKYEISNFFLKGICIVKLFIVRGWE